MKIYVISKLTGGNYWTGTATMNADELKKARLEDGEFYEFLTYQPLRDEKTGKAIY